MINLSKRTTSCLPHCRKYFKFDRKTFSLCFDPKKLGDNKDFLEFILAVLYKLGHSDHVYSEEEDIEIRKVAHVFGIRESLLSKTLKKFSFNIFKEKNA